jgi:hypothetical protein
MWDKLPILIALGIGGMMIFQPTGPSVRRIEFAAGPQVSQERPPSGGLGPEFTTMTGGVVATTARRIQVGASYSRRRDIGCGPLLDLPDFERGVGMDFEGVWPTMIPPCEPGTRYRRFYRYLDMRALWSPRVVVSDQVALYLALGVFAGIRVGCRLVPESESPNRGCGLRDSGFVSGLLGRTGVDVSVSDRLDITLGLAHGRDRKRGGYEGYRTKSLLGGVSYRIR